MKRVVQMVLLLAMIFLVYQFITMLFINEHKVSYILKEDDLTFSIVEEFRKSDRHDYYFEVDVEDHHFAFHNSSNLNKKQHVIQKIESFKTGNVFCIFPVIEGASKQNDILCDHNGAIVAYSYLKQQNDIYADAFVQRLQHLEYQNTSWDQFDQPDSYAGMTIYPGSLGEDRYVAVWNYRGVDLISHDKNQTFSILGQDQYENTHGVMIGKYFVFPDYNQKHEFSQWNMIDIVARTKEELTMDTPISFDSYINGVVGDELFITDRSNLRQFAINFQKKTTREVGNVDSLGTYYAGKWETKSIYDLVNQDLYFQNVVVPQEIRNRYGDVEIQKSYNQYYFKTSDGSFYQTFEGHLDQAILLFQDAQVVDWQVVEDGLYFLSGDTIYQFDDYTGLKRILQNNEFKYNHQNIFGVYKK